jgi:hypothetical protein
LLVIKLTVMKENILHLITVKDQGLVKLDMECNFLRGKRELVLFFGSDWRLNSEPCSC